METLKRGSCGQWVLDLQCALQEAGTLEGDLDGWFGPATEQAVKALQARLGCSATGMVTSEFAEISRIPFTEVVKAALPAITCEGVSVVFPQARVEDLRLNLPYLVNALSEAGLTGREMLAMALATVRTEASAFLPVSEKKSRFNTSPGGKPFDLYDQRLGLGNQGAPDGSLFRGRGFIQLTGRANYLTSGQAVGLGAQLVNQPLRAHRPEIAARLLATYLNAKRARMENCLRVGDLAGARRLVNGGVQGLDVFTTAYGALMAGLPGEITPQLMPRAA